MRRFLLSLLVLPLWAGAALAQIPAPRIEIRDEGVFKGKIAIIDCSGIAITCSVTGARATIDLSAAATLTGAETLSNKTLPSPILSGTVTGTYTLGGTPTLGAMLRGDGTAHIFGSSTGSELMRLTNSGILAIGTTVTTGAGKIQLPNNSYITASNDFGNGSVPLIAASANNNLVQIGPSSGQNVRLDYTETANVSTVATTIYTIPNTPTLNTVSLLLISGHNQGGDETFADLVLAQEQNNNISKIASIVRGTATTTYSKSGTQAVQLQMDADTWHIKTMAILVRGRLT